MIPTAACMFRWKGDMKFDNNFIRAGWEDTDFFNRLGGTIFIDNSLRVVHANQEREKGGVGNHYNQEVFNKKLENK